MQYIGEHLLPGQAGHFLIVLSFVASLLACVAYVYATQRRRASDFEGWRNIGRFAYLIHGLSTFGVIGILFYILTGKMYEYQYAWANISDDLPFRYVFSAFWKEQQGSFLLWSFWHIVLGIVLIVKAGKWETPVLAVIALAEAFIGSMVLGLYFGDSRFGASPFDLLRDTMDAPIFAQADYLTKVKGNGLNPLLQNYWMTIHPPTLFLGFASTVVPFAYAIAGLWTREHKDWLKPALAWSLFSGAILGLGILMGGVWAYEALTFGGYWAWDPVENSSLVPWITLVAGIHTNLIARSTGYSIRSTYGFYLITFILILYSTYLTRSGILQDTSAHAFTEMGLGMQLILFIFAFIGLGAVFFISRYKGVPDLPKEEAVNAREFWMFIGALVLLFSAVLITGATSLPVWNKLVQVFYDPNYKGLAIEKQMDHNNRYQIWIAVFIGLLSGLGQWLRYGERNWDAWKRKFGVHMAVAGGGALLLTALNAGWLRMDSARFYVMLFAGMFALVANADYLFSILKGNLKLAGSAVSHLGFGLLTLGILATGLNKEYISVNEFAMEGLIEGMSTEEEKRNVTLLKNVAMPIRDSWAATYTGDSIERQTRTFTVRLDKIDAAGNKTGETERVYPNVLYDRQFSKVVAQNPSTLHYWNRDIFTFVTALPRAESDPEFAKQQDDSLKYQTYEVLPGDTIVTKDAFIVVEGASKQPVHHEYKAEKGDLAFGLQLTAYSRDGSKPPFRLAPMLCLRPGEGALLLADAAQELQLKAKLSDAAFERLFRLEESLQYEKMKAAQGGSFSAQGYTFTFKSVEREVKHPNYSPEPGDIGVTAILEVTGPNGKPAGILKPAYLIRGNQPLSLKDESLGEGLHARVESLDPQTGNFTFGIARASRAQRAVPVQIAVDVSRTDYIYFQAILFPGINLVWAGSLLMLAGLALGLWRRLTAKQ